MLLTKVFLFSLLTALPFQQNATDPKQALNDQLYEAVRKGDAAAVTALLDKGADVNAKFRYGATALFKAAERGNAAVAKVLLDRGADVKVKDSFYQTTAMTWALDGNHTEVVKLILQKDAESVDDVLMTGARESKEELVKIALERGGAKPETLTYALAVSSANEKSAGVAELLKKAGATPPPQLDAATLQSYAGKYKGDPTPEYTIVNKEGKLFVVGATRVEQPLVALDNTTFRPQNFGGITITFNVEGGKVAGLTFKQGQNTTQMKRVE